MKLSINPVINQKLAENIQHYIFCTSRQSEHAYQTFPNTNLCLAIYRSNKIVYDQGSNSCEVHDGGASFTSRLWGFHEKIFNVSINDAMDQVCILFHPGGLRNFTNIPYEILIKADDPFSLIFGKRANDFLEQLFDTADLRKRVYMLEHFLIGNYKEITKNHTVHLAIQKILKAHGDVKIETLARESGINNSTLYNNFISYIGQSPKDFIKTVRFRAALSSIKQQEKISLTSISYTANYYDQSHFIKEFLQLTGYTPKELRSKAVIEQEKLIWVNNS